MTVQAYVLAMVRSGQSEKVATILREIEGAKVAHMVPGMYDVIARIKGEDSVALGQRLISNIQAIEGIGRPHM